VPVSSHQVKARVASELYIAGGAAALATPWEDAVPAALLLAEAEVYGVLRGRFLTDAQIDAWEGLDAFVLEQATYHALVNSGGLHNWDDKWVEKHNVLERLETVAIAAVTTGPVGRGPLRAVAGEFDGDFIGADSFVDENGRFRDY
jgi:hypothetical protein